MARISIPIDALTSRLNLGDRFSAVRSQSLGQRFANLKPVSEFLDLKRLSKPRDFADVQARVNHNLGYFSSNYAVVFVMLTVYSLLTNWWLLFDIILVAGGGGLGGRPRTPYDVPRWGRPPEARPGRYGRDVWARQDGWESERRFEEVEDSDDGLHGGVEVGYGYPQRRYAWGELQYDDPDQDVRRRRSGDPYEEDHPYSDEDFPGDSTALVRRADTQLMMREKEEHLVERALERIARARALGKTNVRLSQAEVDALDRLEQRQHWPPRAVPVHLPPPDNPPQTSPNVKKKTTTKSKVKDAKKTKQSEKSASPKPKAGPTRARGRSSASDRSLREVNISDYPPSPEPYAYSQSGSGHGSGYYGMVHPASRQSSSQSLRGTQGPLQHPGYQSRYYGPTGDPYDRRPSSKSSRTSRPDPSEPDWEPTTKPRSSSALISFPLDQLPNHRQTARAPRFDPADPRYGSPPKRVVSGPPDVRHYRAPDDTDVEVMSYRVSSDNETSDESTDQGVDVEVIERPSSTGNYAIKTTRSTAAVSKSIGGGRPGGKLGRRK